MPRRRLTPNPDEQPVGGATAEVPVTVEGPTPEELKADGENRVARTGAQSVVALALVTIFDWVVDTATSVDVPATVWQAVGTILTVATAAWMNRKRLRGEAG